ncbi:MAG: flagellar protein FlaG [Zoogloea sp.]|nr:flagellar protein FlaG [Zoogloea sp.]
MQIPSITGTPVQSPVVPSVAAPVSAQGSNGVESAGSSEAAQQAGAAPAVRQPSDTELAKAIHEVQKAIEPVAQNLLFSVDKDSGRTLVKIVDSATDKVIRQIPSEEVLAISKAIDKLQGLLLKDKA